VAGLILLSTWSSTISDGVAHPKPKSVKFKALTIIFSSRRSYLPNGNLCLWNLQHSLLLFDKPARSFPSPTPGLILLINQEFAWSIPVRWMSVPNEEGLALRIQCRAQWPQGQQLTKMPR
jgi:hypothetical protein